MDRINTYSDHHHRARIGKRAYRNCPGLTQEIIEQAKQEFFASKGTIKRETKLPDGTWWCEEKTEDGKIVDAYEIERSSRVLKLKNGGRITSDAYFE